CVYCKAASAVLDMLWESPTARDQFAALGADLSTLGPLVHEVFVPAYCQFKNQQDVATLARLDAEISNELLAPYYEKPTFKEIWADWGDSTRGAFMREQFEAKLAIVLTRYNGDALLKGYTAAYSAYLQKHPARH
ncbi:MAG: hypothetical protein ABI947_01780, partial [Chloroflexota bacterium]